MSKETRKEEIKNIILQYVEDNVLDITKFRINEPKAYSMIAYYFGGINDMLEELNLIKVQKVKSKNNVTFRNRLAYDMINHLRKEHTMEEIGQKYGVSRALVNQLHQSLDLAIKKEKYSSELEKEEK